MTTQIAIKHLNVALRLALFLFILFFGLVFLITGAKDALAANLRAVSTIENNVITLGDVFEGLGKERAAYVLGPAPQPGQDIVLDARTLMRVAVALDLPWRPSSSADQVVLRREATVIGTQKLSSLLESALRNKGVDGNFRIEYNSAAPQIILPMDSKTTAKLTALNFNPQKDGFEATFTAASGTPDEKHLTVNGLVHRLVDVPVLKHNLRNGDIIHDTDMEWISVEADTLQPDTLMKAEELVGQTPRRMALAGKMLRERELQAPELVARGDNVLILFKQGPLLLSAKGRALENGAKNDMIRVVNLGSSRPIDATITASGVVTVSE